MRERYSMTDLQQEVPPEASSSNACGCKYGDGQFCGVDNQCHIYSCQSWYEFGPRNFTGYDANSPLVCQDIGITEPHGDDVFYESVSFQFRSLTPEPIMMGWTNKCTVAGTNSNFTCYGLSASNTDFQPFLDEASPSDLNCTGSEYDETGYPQYLKGSCRK